MTLNVMSLFAGIGGIDLGLERAGMKTVAQVEIDPYCQRVLARHWPEVPRHDDVRTASTWWIAHPGRPRIDIVTGGFPCQPFSTAGRQRGVADERWGWPWMADVIRAVRPRYVVVENVPTLLRSEGFDWVLGDLADLGFDAEWDVLTACSVGAPHARKRLFVLAYAHRRGLQDDRSQGTRDGDALASRRAGPVDVSSAPDDRRSQGGSHWASEPHVDRVVDGLSGVLDRPRLKALGNAVVPELAQVVGDRVMQMEQHRLAAHPPKVER